MSSTKRSFSSGSRVISVAIVEDVSTGAGAEAGSRQALFEGVELTTMDSDRHLRCLSRNLALKFEAMPNFSSSFSQIMGAPPSQPLSPTHYWKLKKMKKTRRMKLMENTEVRVAKSLPSKQVE